MPAYSNDPAPPHLRHLNHPTAITPQVSDVTSLERIGAEARQAFERPKVAASDNRSRSQGAS